MRSKSFIVAFCLFVASVVSGSTVEASGRDTHVYRGKYTNYSDIIYTWDGEHLYRGKYTNYSDILYTWDGKHLYRGKYTNYSDILYTWDGRHLYNGKYTNYSDIMFTWDGKHIYNGKYTNYSDIILTYDGEQLFRHPSDVRWTGSGDRDAAVGNVTIKRARWSKSSTTVHADL